MSIELESESISTPTAQAQQTPCALFLPCCFGQRRRSSWWERVRSTSWSHSQPAPNGDRWWSRGLRALMKLREWSEIVAGPRWKTFIRRFNRNRNSKRMGMAKYQYDPSSYALNFDDGQNGDFHDDSPIRNFSTRYAVVNAKSVSPKAVDSDVAVLV
ncbi:uncharacterized protein LOC113847799 [Abrus precatorius]|uniref:Uncharacterized protein LOC113847799 n=1 Tax=Abrus precatorius TaxID=3816 RepID=A0A8B8JN26_ABRPR|nr:uncharacterized protein LOC113847799 [Abrus precatorius]